MNTRNTNITMLTPQKYTMNLISGKLSNNGETRVFRNNCTYIWCPKLPRFPSELKAEGFSDIDIKEIWDDFENTIKRHRNNEWYHITLHGDERTFWHGFGKYAIVFNCNYYVCPNNLIDESILYTNGFTNGRLYIPFTSCEAYLPIDAKSIEQLIF